METVLGILNPLRAPNSNDVIRATGLAVLTKITLPDSNNLDLISLGVLYVSSSIVPPFSSPIMTMAVVSGGTFYLTNLEHPLVIGLTAASIVWADNFLKRVKEEEEKTG